MDETRCSRCYKCIEVASSTFGVHRTENEDAVELMTARCKFARLSPWVRSPERGEKAFVIMQALSAVKATCFIFFSVEYLGTHGTLNVCFCFFKFVAISVKVKRGSFFKDADASEILQVAAAWLREVC